MKTAAHAMEHWLESLARAMANYAVAHGARDELRN